MIIELELLSVGCSLSLANKLPCESTHLFTMSSELDGIVGHSFTTPGNSIGQSRLICHTFNLTDKWTTANFGTLYFSLFFFLLKHTIVAHPFIERFSSQLFTK